MCIAIIQNPTVEKDDAATLVIPTLIPQLEGILRVFHVSYVEGGELRKVNLRRFMQNDEFSNKFPREIVYPLIFT